MHQENLLTQREAELAAEARAELVAHYAELTREVELRQARAEWKVKRMNLQEKRVAFLQSEETRWEESSVFEPAPTPPPPPVPVVPVPSSVTTSTDLPVKPANVLSESTLPSSIYGSVEHQNDLSHDPITAASHEFTGASLESGGPLMVAMASALGSEEALEFEISEMMSQQTPKMSPEPAEHIEAVAERGLDEASLPSDGDPPEDSKEGLSPLNEDRNSAYLEKTLFPSSEEGYPRLFSTRGQAPRSTIEGIIYGSVEHQNVVTTRGHAPPSTIQHLMYPLPRDSGTANEGEGQQERDQLFDASELLECGPSSTFHDNFSCLGKLDYEVWLILVFTSTVE